MIYLYLSVNIAKAKNLMFNIIFYVVFFNYHFKISRGGFAANFIIECFQKSSLRKLYRSKVEQLIKKEVGVAYFLIGIFTVASNEFHHKPNLLLYPHTT